MATTTPASSVPLPASPSSKVSPQTTPQKTSAVPLASSPSRVPLPSSPSSAKRVSSLHNYGQNRGSIIELSGTDHDADEEALMTSQGVRAEEVRENADDLDGETRYLQLMEALSRTEEKLSMIHSGVYELQEYRHSTKSSLLSPPRLPPSSSRSPLSSSTSDPAPTPSEILLISLNDLLEKTSDLLPPLRSQLANLRPQQPPNEEDESGVGELEVAVVRQRYEDVEDDWNQVVADVEGAKRELKEDRWLDLFRTSASQAEEMMLSLEKAVSQGQDAIYQVRQLQHLPPHTTSYDSNRSSDAWRNPQVQEPITMTGFEVILRSFEAKQQYYVPSVEKSLSILDKGVRERVTKNGETLRIHADMLSRWRKLTRVIERLVSDLASAQQYLSSRDVTHRPRTTSTSSPHALAAEPHYRKASSSTPSEGSTSTRSFPSSDASSLNRNPLDNQQFLATPPSTSSSRSRRSSVLSSGSGSGTTQNLVQRLLGTFNKNGSKADRSSSSSRAKREGSASPLAFDRSYLSTSSSSRSHTSKSSSELSSRRSHPYSATPPSKTSTHSSPPHVDAIPFPSSIPIPIHEDTHLSAMRVAKPRWNASPRVPELPNPSQRPGLERRASNAAFRNGELGGGRPSSRQSVGHAASEAGSDYGGGTPSRHQGGSRIPRLPRSNNLPPETEVAESLDVPSVFLQSHQNQRSFTPNPRQSPRASLPRSHSASRSLSLIPKFHPDSSPSPSNGRPTLSGMPPSSPSLPTLSSLINQAEDDTDSPLTPPSYFGNRQRTFSRSQTPESALRAKVRNSAFFTPGSLATPTPASSESPAGSASPSENASHLRRSRVSMSPSPGPGKTLRPSSIVGPPSSFRGPSPSPNQSLPSPVSSSSPARPPSRTKTASSLSPSSNHSPLPTSRSALLTPTSTPTRPSSRLSNNGGSGAHGSASRPSSRAQTPSGQQQSIPAGPFQPHLNNPLDLALAALLAASPFPSQQNLPIARLTPLPRGAAAAAPEHQTGSFVFGGGVGGRSQKTMQCRLLELNGGRSATSEGGKIKKVMCRVGGGWLDLEVQLNKLGF